MRTNPLVCVEFEELVNPQNWATVIVLGKGAMTSQSSSEKNVPVSMKKGTKPFQVIAAIFFSIALPAVAESYADKAQDTLSDTQTIQKDDAAIGYDIQSLKYNRVAKAAETINDNSAAQAVNDTKIAANQSAIK